ncbi:MAG: DUF5615 family PIN-like protein [Cyanobacteria bacterium P01_F01_bin.143]
MKLLLDECIDRRLAREFVGQNIKTVRQMGWTGTKNGKLLALAEKEFDVFITVDRNLSFEQNLPSFNIAVVVLKAYSNRLADLKPLVSQIMEILPTLVKGQAVIVE